MVCFSQPNKQKGSGIIDSLMKNFTFEKYPGERHAYSLNPNTFMKPFSYVGPGTAVKLREQLGDNVALDDLDKFAKEHDYAYLHEKEAYDRDHDKQKHINNVWAADDKFINQAANSKNEVIMGPIASKLIQTKENLEKAGMDTKRFSGFGTETCLRDTCANHASDPVARLRQLARKHYNKQQRTVDKKDPQNKLIKGGIGPLAAIAIPALGALAGKLTSDLYDFVKRKITGSGVKMNHKTQKDQKEFLLNLIKHV